MIETQAALTSNGAAQPKLLRQAEEFAALIERFDTFLFDLDGVIWSGPAGDVLTPHIVPTLRFLRSRGKHLAFITNNATRSRAQYLDKLHGLGFTQVQREEVFTCGYASALHLKEVILPAIKDESKRGIYLIGQASMEEELSNVGLKWKGGTDPNDNLILADQDFSAIKRDPSIGVVLYSFDMHIQYLKLARAFLHLTCNEGCQLVMTNDDYAMTTREGGKIPGEGALASVLYGAAGDRKIIVGKPHQPLLDVVHKQLKFDAKRTIMVGDRLETDVLFGKLGGLATLLVLTGSSQLADLKGLPANEIPDFIAENVGEILKAAPPLLN